MGAFMFVCPATGLKIQGFASDEPPAFDHYEAVECPACRRVHLVDPRTGKVAGAESE